MKKLIAIILSALMLIPALGGCKTGDGQVSSATEVSGTTETGEQEPLRVFIDVEFGSNVFVSIKDYLREFEEELINGKTAYKSFKDVIEELGGPEDMELEIPPKCGHERDTYLTALRTEIMAGKGPDMFVTLSGYGNHWDDATLTDMCRENALFQFPQQAMERNIFLPLDGYIEKAQFMEWDKLTPAVMAAGKNEHGQLLLPMTYTVPVSIFRSEDVDFRLEGNTGLSFGDLLSGGPEMVSTAADSSASMQSSALWPMADYKNDTLAITEEELLEYITARMDAKDRCKQMDVPDGSIFGLYPDNWFDNENGGEHELTMVPNFSRSGGYCAVVTSFVGINANTKRPQDAFFIADYIMSKDGQQSNLYPHMTCGNAVPTMEGLLAGRGDGVRGADGKYVYMSKNLYSEFLTLRDGIAGADFYTPLDAELFDLGCDSYDSPETVEKLVHDTYMRMNMELAES